MLNGDSEEESVSSRDRTRLIPCLVSHIIILFLALNAHIYIHDSTDAYIHCVINLFLKRTVHFALLDHGN